MKKWLSISVAFILTFVLATPALAVTVIGPSVTFTAATGTKASTSSEPYLHIYVFSAPENEYFVFWVTNNSVGKQVSPAYYFYSGGTKTIYYMAESRTAGYVQAGVSYSARFRTSQTIPAGTSCTLQAAFSP